MLHLPTIIHGHSQAPGTKRRILWDTNEPPSWEDDVGHSGSEVGGLHDYGEAGFLLVAHREAGSLISLRSKRQEYKSAPYFLEITDSSVLPGVIEWQP